MSHTPNFGDFPYGYQLTEEEREAVACWQSGRSKRTAFVSPHGREIDDAFSRTSALVASPTRRIPASPTLDRYSRTADEDVRNASLELLSLGREAANFAQPPICTRRPEPQEQPDLKPKTKAVSKCRVSSSSTAQSKLSIDYILANVTRASPSTPKDTGKSTQPEARIPKSDRALQAQSDKILVDNVVAYIRQSNPVRVAASGKSVRADSGDKRTGNTSRELIEVDCEEGPRQVLEGDNEKDFRENTNKCLGGNDEKSSQQPGKEIKIDGEEDSYEYVPLPMEEEWEKVEFDGDWDFVKK